MADAPAEPILERIAAELATTIGAISAGASYRTTIASVTRPDANGMPSGLGHMGAVLGLLTDAPHDSARNTASENRLASFRLFVAIEQSEADTTAFETTMIRVVADVFRALKVDVSRGGLACDTMWDGVELMRDTGAHNGVVVDFSVWYEVSEADPYSL